MLNETALEERQYCGRQNLTVVRIAANPSVGGYLIEHALAYGQIFRSDKLSLRRSKHRGASRKMRRSFACQMQLRASEAGEFP